MDITDYVKRNNFALAHCTLRGMLHCRKGGNAKVLSCDQAAMPVAEMLYSAEWDGNRRVNTLICADCLLRPRITSVLSTFSVLICRAARQKGGFFWKPYHFQYHPHGQLWYYIF